MTRLMHPAHVSRTLVEAAERAERAAHAHAVRPTARQRQMDVTGRALCDAIRIEKAGDDRDRLDAILAEDEAAMIEAGYERALRREIIGELWQGRLVALAIWAICIALAAIFVGMLIFLPLAETMERVLE